MKWSRTSRQNDPINIYYIYGLNSKIMQEKTGKIRIGYWNMRPMYIQAIVCADDIVIIANSEAELERAVIEWASVCREREMEISVRVKYCTSQKEYREN
jgi:hypothetical protein